MSDLLDAVGRAIQDARELHKTVRLNRPDGEVGYTTDPQSGFDYKAVLTTDGDVWLRRDGRWFKAAPSFADDFMPRQGHGWWCYEGEVDLFCRDCLVRHREYGEDD